MNIDRVDESRAKALRPRDWQRLARDLEPPRPPGRRDRLGQAREGERVRRRPEVELVVCAGCGVALAEVRVGGQVWCRRCRLWSGGAAEPPGA